MKSTNDKDKYLDLARLTLKEATDEDSPGNEQNALQKYIAAADYFNLARRASLGQQAEVAKIDKFLKGIIDRAEQLKRIGHERAAARPSASAASLPRPNTNGHFKSSPPPAPPSTNPGLSSASSSSPSSARPVAGPSHPPAGLKAMGQLPPEFGRLSPVLPSAPPVQFAVQQGWNEDSRRRVLLGTVQILCGSCSGSGTVISRSGYILTNEHVISSNQPIGICVNSQDLKTAPQVRFIAQVVQADATLDLALLKVVADYRKQHDPNFSFDIEPVGMGNSSNLLPGDELLIVGFPGLGGSTVTVTKGIVSGYMESGKWIKTDAEINPGNSGGGAFKDGLLVAVASAAAESSKGVPGKLGLLRPLAIAQNSVLRAMS